MSVQLSTPNQQDIFAVPGIQIGIAQAGVKRADKDDVTVFLLDEGTQVGGVFTKNGFKAAPVQICEAVLSGQTDAHTSKAGGDTGFNATHSGGRSIRALVINTGNANAGTGARGAANAQLVCAELAKLLNVSSQQILPFSTGVIMEQLPAERIVNALPAALRDAGTNQWWRAAHSIMTTDTVAKAFSERVMIEGVSVTITGIAKGAGMIHPNMATMLGFLATDACIAHALMREGALALANASFNRITVDGDTSTNDSFVLMATHKAPHQPIQSWSSEAGAVLFDALKRIATRLAQAIVRDAEGATKFITLRVSGGKNVEECKAVALAVAHSPLVKTAFFASDPNLGRILAAVGYAGIEDLDQSRIEMYLDDVHVASQGARCAHYKEEDGQRVMSQEEITVGIDLGRGSASDTFWTCDLSHEYVRINADYRS